MPTTADSALLLAYCNGVATTYNYYHMERGLAIPHEYSDLPSDELMDAIQAVRQHPAEWTAFSLSVDRNGLFTTTFYDDLNPVLECSTALLWLAYAHFQIEPDSEYTQSLLQDALKAESFKKTLNYACMKQNIAEVKSLLQQVKMSALDKKSSPGGTPLHIVCQNGNLEIAELLVASGAKLDSKYNRDTPFTTACYYGNWDIIHFLLCKGEDYNQTIPGKVTALHLLSSSGSGDAVKGLIDWGANMHAVTSTKYSTLHYAAESDNARAAAVLIRRGIDLELKENYKRSALHLACYWNKLNVAAVLLESGANINSTRENRITPLHTAAEQGFYEMAKLLLAHRPDLEATAVFHSFSNKNIETPLETAIRCGNHSIAKLIRTFS